MGTSESRGEMRERVNNSRDVTRKEKPCGKRDLFAEESAELVFIGAGRCVTDVQHRNEWIADCGFGKLSSAQDGATFSGK